MEDSDESPPYLPAVKPSAPHPDEEHVVEKPVWEKDFKLFQDSIKKEKTKKLWWSHSVVGLSNLQKLVQ